MAARTGNLAIEYYNVKKASPSGISSTKSDLWVVVLENEVWISATRKLRKYFNETKPHRTIECGGDDNAAFKLYRKEEILEAVFYRIDNINKLALTNLISSLL